MKTISLFSATLLITLFFSFSSVVSAQNVSDQLKKCNCCELVANQIPKGMDKAWTMSLPNMDKPVTVCLEHHRHQDIYHVCTSMIEFTYVSDDAHFGYKDCQTASKAMPSSIIPQIVNEHETERQAILTNSRVTAPQALALISSYFSDLINPGFQIQ